MEKKPIRISPEQLLDPAQIRNRLIQEEAEKRFSLIADKLLEVLAKEKVLVSEISTIVSVLTSKINKKFDEAPVESIIKLL